MQRIGGLRWHFESAQRKRDSLPDLHDDLLGVG